MIKYTHNFIIAFLVAAGIEINTVTVTTVLLFQNYSYTLAIITVSLMIVVIYD